MQGLFQKLKIKAEFPPFHLQNRGGGFKILGGPVSNMKTLLIAHKHLYLCLLTLLLLCNLEKFIILMILIVFYIANSMNRTQEQSYQGS